MSLLRPGVEEIAEWVEIISESLPAADLESRLALSNLVAAITQSDTSVRVLASELARLRGAAPKASYPPVLRVVPTK